jgi:hypothetical protein
VVQTLVVVLHYRETFLSSAGIFGVGVDDVAREEVLPEGETAAGTWRGEVLVSMGFYRTRKGSAGAGGLAESPWG